MTYMNKKLAITLFILVDVVIIAWFFWPRGEVAVIDGRLDALERLCSKGGQENPVASALRAKEIGEFFVDQPDVLLNVPHGRATSREDLVSAMTALRTMVTSAEVSFGSRAITIAENGRDAVVVLYVEAAAVSKGGKSERYGDTYRMEWIKRGGEWLVRAVMVAE